MEKFHGRDDFEKLDGDYYTNDLLIDKQSHLVDWVDDVADDAIYLNYCDGGDRINPMV